MVALVLWLFGAAVVNTALAGVLSQWMTWPWAVLITSPMTFVLFVFLCASAMED